MNKEFEGCIYEVVCRVNGKKYVGQTTNFKHRKSYHLTPSTHKYNANPLYLDIIKYGKDNFEFNVLLEIKESDENIFKFKMLEQEKYFITLFDSINNGYNLELGNELTAKMKIHLSEIAKGRKGYWTGKHLSEKIKRKISKAQKGKPAWNKGLKLNGSQKNMNRDKIGKPSWNKGLINAYSKKTLKKMSEGRKGKCAGKDSGRARKVINIDTGLIFDTIQEAAKCYKITYSNISNCCAGRIKTSGGYHWKYFDERK